MRERAFCLAAALLGLSGCAILAATPPTAQVESVHLTTIGVNGPLFEVVLCIGNPNGREIRLTSIEAAIDVADAPLAEAVSNSTVALPAHASVRVPFTVVTSVLSLGPQIASVLRSGDVAYRLHGMVRIAKPFELTLPFDRSGKLDVLATVPDVLTDADAAGAGACIRPPV